MDRSRIPVVHCGGQQRPLNTSRCWAPSSDEEEEPTTRALSDIGSGSLAPRSALWNPSSSAHRPALQDSPQASVSHSGSASSSSGVAPARLLQSSSKAKAKPKPKVFLTPAGTPRLQTANWLDNFPHPGLPSASTVPFDVQVGAGNLVQAQLHPSVEAYLWRSDQECLFRVEGPLPFLPGSILALDWHQTLDIDRINRSRAERVDANSVIPHRHREFLTELLHICRSSVRPVRTGTLGCVLTHRIAQFGTSSELC